MPEIAVNPGERLILPRQVDLLRDLEKRKEIILYSGARASEYHYRALLLAFPRQQFSKPDQPQS